jgi:hypothetical protein
LALDEQFPRSFDLHLFEKFISNTALLLLASETSTVTTVTSRVEEDEEDEDEQLALLYSVSVILSL